MHINSYTGPAFAIFRTDNYKGWGTEYAIAKTDPPTWIPAIIEDHVYSPDILLFSTYESARFYMGAHCDWLRRMLKIGQAPAWIGNKYEFEFVVESFTDKIIRAKETVRKSHIWQGPNRDNKVLKEEIYSMFKVVEVRWDRVNRCYC